MTRHRHMLPDGIWLSWENPPDGVAHVHRHPVEGWATASTLPSSTTRHNHAYVTPEGATGVTSTDDPQYAWDDPRSDPLGDVTATADLLAARYRHPKPYSALAAHDDDELMALVTRIDRRLRLLTVSFAAYITLTATLLALLT